MSLREAIMLFLAVYGAVAAAIGALNHRRRESSQHFLHTSRDLSLWVVSLSFLAANCSALEVLTVIAIAAKYGLMAVHFYWIGAVPGLVFLLCVMLPRYQALGVRSVPEYLDRRFGRSTRLLSAGSFCLLMVAVAGITLCIGSRLLHLTLGLPYGFAIWSMTAGATAFLLAGGLSGVIYSEALQLLVLLGLLVPLTVRTLREAGGLARLVGQLPDSERHTLAGAAWFAPHAVADRFGVVVGLGLVLGISYWCADFLLIQRLGVARTEREMRQTPLAALGAKLVLPLLFVVPGIAAWIRYGRAGEVGSFDLSLFRLLLDRYPQGLAAVAIAAMMASLFFGFCGNISAGVAIFTSDIYAPMRRGRTDRHYLTMARIFTVCMTVAAAGAAFLAFGSNSLMEYIQLVLSSLNVPVAAVFLLGIFVPRLARRAGSVGLLAGTAAGLLSWALAPRIGYGSGLTQSFYGAVAAAAASALGMAVASVGVSAAPAVEGGRRPPLGWGVKALAGAALGAMVVLYAVFR